MNFVFEAGNISHFIPPSPQSRWDVPLPSVAAQGGAAIGPLRGAAGTWVQGGVCGHPLQDFHGQQHSDPLSHTFPCILLRFSRHRHPPSNSKIPNPTGVTGSEANWLSRKLCKWKAIILVICDQAKGDSISGVSLVPCSQPGWRCQVNSEGLCQAAFHQFELKKHCQLKISIGMIFKVSFLLQHLIKSRIEKDWVGELIFSVGGVGRVFLLFIPEGDSRSWLLPGEVIEEFPAL